MIQDVGQLQEVSRQTFVETFAEANSEADMKKFLEKVYSIEKLTAELLDENVFIYFATLDDQVIGYVKLNTGPSQTEIKEDQGLEIERIYVLRQFHGKAVGQLLYKHALNIARERNAEYIWLGVWEKNLRAIQFYKKNGFIAFDKHLFKLGDDEQIDIMMKLELLKSVHLD